MFTEGPPLQPEPLADINTALHWQQLQRQSSHFTGMDEQTLKSPQITARGKRFWARISVEYHGDLLRVLIKFGFDREAY